MLRADTVRRYGWIKQWACTFNALSRPVKRCGRTQLMLWGHMQTVSVDAFYTAAFPCVAQYTGSIQVDYWSHIVRHYSSTQFLFLKDTDDENWERVID